MLHMPLHSLVKIELGRSANAHVNAIFIRQTGLSFEFFNAIESWRFYAIAPEGTPLERLCQFDVGGLCSEHEALTWLIQFCGDELAKGGPLTFLADDVYFGRRDSPRQANGVTHHIVGESLVYSAKLTPGHASLVANVLRSTRSWDIVCFLLAGDVSNLEEPKRLVPKILYILATAYDRESFLLGKPVTKS